MSTLIQITPSSANFANTDLTFTGTRNHDTAGNALNVYVDIAYDKGYFDIGPFGSTFGFNRSFHSYGTNSIQGYANNSLIQTLTQTGVGIGTNAPAARLDVRAQGALSTDVAFRVRNSANSADLLSVAGDGTISAIKAIFTTPAADGVMIWRRNDSGQSWILSNPANRWSLANSGGNDITLSLNVNSVDQNNKVGIGVVPTASLTIRAGTTTLAPLKLTSGTNLTTPENGAFEFDGTNLYFTVGGIRKIVSLI
jgi:hypothetical protein